MKSTLVKTIVEKMAVVIMAVVLSLFSFAPVHASYLLGYLDNGDGTLYDEERDCYVSADDYHAAYGYVYWDEVNAYGYWDNGSFYHCNCNTCQYIADGHNIVIPDNNKESFDNTDSNTNTREVVRKNTYMVGTQLSAECASSEDWEYDADSNTLTLNSFNYEGTGVFTMTDSDEDSSDEENDGGSEDFEESDDEDGYDDSGEDTDSEDDNDDPENVVQFTGAIHSEGNLTLHLNGTNHINITDENSDASYGVNVAGELKIDGEGVLYIKSATEEKVYGTEPTEEVPGGNSGVISNNTNDTDNIQMVNEAPVTQNVEISLPGNSNNITFNPNVNVELPKSSAEKIVLSGMQQRYPEVMKTVQVSPTPLGKCMENTAEIDAEMGKEDKNSESEEIKGVSSESPETGDGIDLGALMAFIATVLLSGGTGTYFLVKRLREK